MDSFNNRLLKTCIEKNNRLCLGLDLDNRKLKVDTLSYFEGFIKDIIDTTIDLCPIYKINFAFYERLGKKGYHILDEITQYINGRAITIADAKRGDIGNSSKYYAEAIFNTLNYDSITVSPYMGYDSVLPFCENKSKGVFILCLTSNQGSNNFQNKMIQGEELYKHVAKFAVDMNTNNNIGLVVGATQPDKMLNLKEISKNLPWLIPGVGHQGGSLDESIKISSKNDSIGIINVSRGILNYNNGTIKDIFEATKLYTEKIRGLL